MNDRLTRFYQEIKGEPVSFLGLGRSHKQLLELFARKGAAVTLRDQRTRDQIGEEECARLEGMGITLLLGKGYLNGLNDAGMILRTPGISYTLPEIQAAKKAGAAVTSEMELFFDLCPCKIYGVTGSDGKTTTTSIIAKLLEEQGKKVFLGGNIGFPVLPRIEEIGGGDAAVVELSSFQLISMRRSPDVAVVTNLAPNHLDVHRDMDEYIDAKRNIYLHQNGQSKTILNADNEITASFAEQTRGKTLTFSRLHPVPQGAFLNEKGVLCMAEGNDVIPVLHQDSIRIPGTHNVENYLAAIAAVWGDVSREIIQKVAEEFPGVEHRIEFVRELDGVKWYNDSIASSPTRTIAGLNSFPQKVILIAGGYDKKIPFAPLAPKIIEKVKALILLGSTSQKIEDVVKGCTGYDPAVLPILRTETMEQAVAAARSAAAYGDIVTLSPACAAFDLYRDFEARGRHYKELVNHLDPEENS